MENYRFRCTTAECEKKLQPLLTQLHEGSEEERRRFMAACVASMRQHAAGRASDGRSLLFKKLTF